MPRYIDAEDAIYELERAFPIDDYGKIIRCISRTPTADVVERKVGKWIRHSIGHKNTPWGFDCSVCGKWFVIGEDTAERYHYCPNCGAEMKGEDDGLD